MEDYEYLWLLDQEVKRLDSRRPEPPGLAAARELLTVPSDISQDLTHFTTDPRRILRQRDRIARAIVALRSLR